MKKVFIFLILFFMFVVNVNADSKYIRVGCEECKDNCIIKSGEIFKESEIEDKETYNSIKIPDGYTVYNNSSKLKERIYYDGETELLFGCKENNLNTDSSSEKEESNGQLNLEIGEERTCEELLSNNAKLFIKYAIVFVRIMAPILMIVLSSYDFMKAIPNKDDDAMIKAFKSLETRAIVTVLIMLLPTIINILARLFGVFDSCSIW